LRALEVGPKRKSTTSARARLKLTLNYPVYIRVFIQKARIREGSYIHCWIGCGPEKLIWWLAIGPRAKCALLLYLSVRKNFWLRKLFSCFFLMKKTVNNVLPRIVFMFPCYEKTVNNVLPRNASVFSSPINIFARRPD